MEKLTNLPRSVKKKAFSIEGFNDYLANNPDISEHIAGYSSLSLQQVIKGTQNGYFKVMRYGYEGEEHVNCHLTPSAFKHVFSDEVPYEFKSLESNRDFAEPWVIRDLALKHFGNRELGEVLYYDIHDIRSAARQLLSGGHVELNDLFNFFVKRPNYDFEDSKKVLREAFPTNQILEDFLNTLVDSCGVQLVYGKVRPFSNFLKGNIEPWPIDDTGVTVLKDIPGRLVLALICLGYHEKSAFGIA